MKKVLIMGGAGFIGVHLARHLLEIGYQVDLLDNFSRGVNDSALKSLSVGTNVRLLNFDLLHPDVFDNLENDYNYIYQLAAILGVANVLERPYAVLCDNVAMLMNILSYTKRQNDLKRLLFFSTSEVYAGTLKNFTLQIPTPESTPLGLTDLDHPRTTYMLSKIYGEAMCLHFGVPVTIVRPHNIYGPRMGMAHVIPELLRKAYNAENGEDIEVFSVDHSRTFCYVKDAVKMIKLAAESPACLGQTLNIGNQQPEISMGELATLVIKVTGKKLGIIEKPATSGSPLRRCPDMTKSIKLTGYKASVTLEEGVEMTYHWYKNNIFEGRDVSAR